MESPDAIAELATAMRPMLASLNDEDLDRLGMTYTEIVDKEHGSEPFRDVLTWITSLLGWEHTRRQEADDPPFYEALLKALVVSVRALPPQDRQTLATMFTLTANDPKPSEEVRRFHRAMAAMFVMLNGPEPVLNA